MADGLVRAEAANRAKDRFLTSMSHEIRMPLTGILRIAQIDREAARSDQEKELAGTLMSSGRIRKSMVDDILDPARMDRRNLRAEVVRLSEADMDTLLEAFA